MKSREWQEDVVEAKAKLEAENLQQTWKRNPQEVIRHMRELIAQGKARPEHVVVLCLEAARLREESNPQGAVSAYLTAAELAQRRLKQLHVPAAQWPEDPEGKRLLSLYNWAVSRFVALEFNALRTGAPQEVTGLDGGRFQVTTYHERVFGLLPPDYFDELTPTDELQITGFRHPHRTNAVGAPFVGYRKYNPERDWEMAYQGKRGTRIPTTALLLFPDTSTGPHQAKVALVDASMRDKVTIDGSQLPVSVDRTSPFAMRVQGLSQWSLGLGGFLRGEQLMDKAGLYMVGPYDPHRIPVLMVHGLQSSPLMWRDMVDQLQADPKIAANYQFWLFYYPSGQPVPFSAKLLRDNLEGLNRHFDPNNHDVPSRNMVAIGHSMGGIICRTLITDIGDRGWKAISNKNFEDLDLPPDKKEQLRKVVFFKPMPEVKRVVFICAPLRGAHMADSFIGRIGKMLVSLPLKILDVQSLLFDANSLFVRSDVRIQGVASSINSLSPNAPVIKALNDSPFVPGVPYHTIIGDRGRGDTPNSSDGVVDYWSSHLDGAASELIVPSDHGAYNHPMAIAEVRRILLLHLRQNPPPSSHPEAEERHSRSTNLSSSPIASH